MTTTTTMIMKKDERRRRKVRAGGRAESGPAPRTGIAAGAGSPT